MTKCEQSDRDRWFILADPRRAERARAARLLHPPHLVDLAVGGLCEHDELASALLDEFDRLPATHGRHLLEAALDDGLDAIADAPSRVRELVAELITPPSWVDQDLFDRGAAMWWRISMVNSVAMLAALVSAYQYGDLVKPLVMNGRFRQMGARRFEETARWTIAAAAPGAMLPRSEGFRETVRLRMLHATIGRNFAASGRWNELAWGAPVNMTAASLTNIGFFLAPLRGLQLAGVPLSDDDCHAMAHQWSAIGSMLGLPDRLLPDSVEWADEFRLAAFAVLDEPDDSSREMVASLRENVISPAAAFPEFIEIRAGASMRRVSSRALMAMSRPFIEQHVSRETADLLGVPNGPLTHWIKLARPFVKMREAVRRTGLLGSDLEIGERQRRAFGRRLDLMGAAHRPARVDDMPTPAQLRADPQSL
ncbi:oxygenase MpaB family protein [Gordonia sp. PKS22-38]|uniref:Oxygenase MpaB family protein n=1 Tax=Gordonia prachuapensis TaxID=3115651 RepID=A0ABU7MRW9_9ACTN|nr:oxygenase MpaB family protein [Gordonia sp. PKS22-38]